LEIAINHILMLTKEEIFEKQGPDGQNPGDLNNLLQPEGAENFFDNQRSGSRASAWIEAHKSLRESLSVQSRAASLIIDPSALQENPNFYRTSSKISNLSVSMAAPQV
jgi:hypothetical protein